MANATQTPTIEVIEANVDPNETQAPTPIRTIRKVNGVYRWIDLEPSELSDDELRQIFVAAFSPCEVA